MGQQYYGSRRHLARSQHACDRRSDQMAGFVRRGQWDVACKRLRGPRRWDWDGGIMET